MKKIIFGILLIIGLIYLATMLNNEVCFGNCLPGLVCDSASLSCIPIFSCYARGDNINTDQYGTYCSWTESGPHEPCWTTDTITSTCDYPKLCNIYSNGPDEDGRFWGDCMTVEDCIFYGSTADAYEGSEVCFRGV